MQWAGHTSWLLSKFKYMDASSCASCVKHNSIKDREICGHCLMGQFIFPAFSNSFCGSHKWFGAQVPFYVCNINSYACQNSKSEEPLWYLHGFHLMGCFVSSLYQVVCSLSFRQYRRLPHHSYIQQKRKNLFYFSNMIEGSKSMMPTTLETSFPMNRRKATSFSTSSSPTACFEAWSSTNLLFPHFYRGLIRHKIRRVQRTYVQWLKWEGTTSNILLTARAAVGTLHVAKGYIQKHFEKLWGWRSHSFSGQLSLLVSGWWGRSQKIGQGQFKINV